MPQRNRDVRKLVVDLKDRIAKHRDIDVVCSVAYHTLVGKSSLGQTTFAEYLASLLWSEEKRCGNQVVTSADLVMIERLVDDIFGSIIDQRLESAHPEDITAPPLDRIRHRATAVGYTYRHPAVFDEWIALVVKLLEPLESEIKLLVGFTPLEAFRVYRAVEIDIGKALYLYQSIRRKRPDLRDTFTNISEAFRGSN